MHLFAIPSLALLPVAAADAIATGSGQPAYVQLVSVLVGGAVSVAGLLIANGRLARSRKLQDEVEEKRTDELIAELRTQLAEAKAELADLRRKR